MNISINGRMYDIEKQWYKETKSQLVTMILTSYGYWFVSFATKGKDNLRFYRCGSKEKANELFEKA